MCPDEVSDVLYKIEEDLFDADVVINCIETFLDLWQTAKYL